MPPEPFNGVIDLCHHNGTVDLQQASQHGIVSA
jgi:hypothetical protein